MKKISSRWILMVSASLIICLSTVQKTNAQANVSLQTFYDELQPYGTWINDNQYGYVWSPDVGAGFTPYSSNGYWVNTSYGNTWVSDYSWGWAPFHYGRWVFDDYYGWLWVPDTTWAPAWVAWRSGGGYYGWAPLMPGFGISVSVGYYNRIPHNYWSFVPSRYVMYHNVYNHCVSGPRVVNVINNTTIINNYNNNSYGNGGRDRSYFTGPSRNEIEQRNHERVPVYNVDDRSKPGRTEVGRNSVAMYRPTVDNSGSSRNNAAPSRLSNDDRTTVVGREPFNRSNERTMPRDVRESQLPGERVNTQNNDGVRTMPVERSTFDRRPFEQNDQRNNNDQRSNNDAFNNRDAVERFQRSQNQNNDLMNREQSIQRTQREQTNQRQQMFERSQQQPQQSQMRMPERVERSQPQRQFNMQSESQN